MALKSSNGTRWWHSSNPQGSAEADLQGKVLGSHPKSSLSVLGTSVPTVWGRTAASGPCWTCCLSCSQMKGKKWGVKKVHMPALASDGPSVMCPCHLSCLTSCHSLHIPTLWSHQAQEITIPSSVFMLPHVPFSRPLLPDSC